MHNAPRVRPRPGSLSGGCGKKSETNRLQEMPDMKQNETIRQLLDRRSVRVFQDVPVTEEEKESILLAACCAPTAGNQQLYSILDITDREIKNRLAVLCDDQPFIASAPLVLIFAADQQRWYDAYLLENADPRQPEEGDLVLAVTDACIAAQNSVTAAQSLGIGSCYIGDIMENCAEIRALLDLPPYVFPCAMLVFGRPVPFPAGSEKPPRFALPDIVFENRYNRKTGDALRSAMAVKNTGVRPYADWVRAFCRRKYASAFSKEMSRSVREYLSSFSGRSDQL